MVAAQPHDTGSAQLSASASRPIRVAGQELLVYTEPVPLLQKLIDDVRNARDRVWVESYIILDDWIGQELSDALLDRAAAGLDVRMLYDAAGSHSTPQAFFDRLRRGGGPGPCVSRAAAITAEAAA